jgi:hypothetical protein
MYKMRITLIVIGFILCGILSLAQSNVVTATATDSDGIVWQNGSWSLSFRPNPNIPNVNQYNINGTPLNPSVLTQSGSLDNSGHLSITLYNSQAISPAGSSWNLTVCPNASSACGTTNFATTSTLLVDITSFVNSAIPAPRFPGVSGSYGYRDVEVVVTNAPGQTYYNVVNNCIRVYNGSTWACTSGG